MSESHVMSLPGPNTTLGIVLGASHWPKLASLARRQAFLESANEVRSYVCDPEGLGADQFLWLFDDPRSPSQQLERLREFISETVGSKPADVIVNVFLYCIGHGAFTRDRHFCMPVVATFLEGERTSNLVFSDLAALLKEFLPDKTRIFVIIDTCFAEAAVVDFMGGDFVAAAIERGMAVLCSAPRDEPALAPLNERLTRFTGALLDVLSNPPGQSAPGSSMSGPSSYVSFAELENLVSERLRSAADGRAPKPRLHSPDGNIADVKWLPRGPRTPNRRFANVLQRMQQQHDQWKQRLAVETEQKQEQLRKELRAEWVQQREGAEAEWTRRLEDAEKVWARRLEDADKRVIKRSVSFALAIFMGIMTASALALRLMFQKIDTDAAQVREDLVTLTTSADTTRAHVEVIEGSVTELRAEQTVVYPTMGWQRSIPIEKDKPLCIYAGGRVHLGSNQVDNLMNDAKALIAKYAPDGSQLSKFRDAIGPPDLHGRNIFRRRWHGPEGEKVEDEMLDTAKLIPKANWGALVAIVLPQHTRFGDMMKDPYEVLASSGGDIKDAFVVGNYVPFTPSADGYLTFIVNDAVNSEYHTAPQVSRDLADALVRAARALQAEGDRYHVIHEDNIPLFWYADNLGSYAVSVKFGACGSI